MLRLNTMGMFQTQELITLRHDLQQWVSKEGLRALRYGLGLVHQAWKPLVAEPDKVTTVCRQRSTFDIGNARLIG